MSQQLSQQLSQPSVTAAAAAPAPRAALGLLAATAASVVGNAMVAVLVPWLVLSRTGSAAEAGLVGAVSLAAAVPALLLGGPLIDRLGRRRVSTGADLLSAAAVAALPLLDAVVGLSLVTTLALVGLGALFDGAGAAAREASRPAVAAASGTPLATLNARGEAVDGAGQVAGPALAGVGLGALGATGSLWVGAALFVVAAAVTRWSLPPDPVPTLPREVGQGRESHLRAAATGVRHLWADPTLRAVTVLGMVAMAFVAPLSLVLTAHLAPQGRGGALAALAVGAVVGALASGPVVQRVPRRGVVAGSITAASAGFAVMALAVAADPTGTGWLLAAAAATGLAVGPVNPLLVGLTQERTPDHLLGRVVSTTWSLSLLASPLGMLGAGFLLQATSPVVALAVVAAGCLVTAAYAASTRGLRRLEPVTSR